MSSGTAYRWDQLGMDFLHLYPTNCNSRPVVNLYKAPSIERTPGKLLVPSFASQLSIELIHQIFFELDVSSLGRVRQVNLATRHLVESFPAYQLLREHASDALRVMHATKCASLFPIRWLFTEFCQPWCRACGKFGPYLYLAILSRLCFQCCLFSPDHQVAPIPHVMFHLSITRYQIKSLPVIHNIPRKKIPGEGTRPRQFVDVAQARELGLRKHGSSQRIKQLAMERVRAVDDDYRQRRDQFRRGLRDRSVRRRRIAPHPLRSDHALFWRHCGTTAFPYWDRETQTLEPGTYCRACTYHWEEKVAKKYLYKKWPKFPLASWTTQPLAKLAYDRAFRVTDLPEHFLHCPAVTKNYDYSRRRGSIGWPWRRRGDDFLVDATGNIQWNNHVD
ncbi:uncharacterized protein BDW47DRAFT_133534 [Aspergillus candidus]|uniref:F-box domain-containing protein n=1 Tax=Aspergillus candidus TaxID=41067 RepID=A0A2I2F3U8_ASPCN|nr:hypothetical protein BDW47DRAFT_133534 [Aspergillus candidus]PLB35313.1 hypothetical protein BDW47DRAFT_133534 [Aspergillus candidus]